jgi:hypothetical protein
MPSPSPVRVVSRHIVKPPPRSRERIPLTSWDVAMLSANYIQKGLLFAQPPFPTAELVDHLEATLANTLATYYPVAGRFVTEQHRDDHGDAIIGSLISIDCGGQGVEIHHAVAEGVAVADVIPPDADIPLVVESLFPLNDAMNSDGHVLPSSLFRSRSSSTASSSGSRATARSATALASGTFSTRGRTSLASAGVLGVRLISNSNWANGSVGPVIRTLIGGIQPIYGWRALSPCAI